MGCRGAALTQSRSDSGVYTGLYYAASVRIVRKQRHMRCEIPHRCVRRKRQFRCSSASSLTDSLRSVVRLRRAEMAYERGGDFLEDARKKLNRETIRPRQSRFSIGSAPLTSITKSDAQISGGETRQDYKDPRRFPLVAPSCALLFLPFGLPVSFRCYGRVYLIPRLTLSSG